MGSRMVPVLRLASDQRLAEYVSAGSERAFEVLYDRHHRPVLSFCRHMLGSLDEAEDALQHTFMAAYRDLIRSGAPAALRPWLFVIARNRCISVLRTRRETPAADVPERASDRLASDVAMRDELRAVFAGVARLPDDQRAALVLSELGDVTHDEIARILDCRREQVKSFVFQARAALAADRVARNTPCAEIREQLAEFRGAQLRRTSLRRHVDDCPGCREYRETLRAQRRQLRALLPVAPALGLKRAVLGAVFTGGGGGAGLSVGGLAATALIAVAIPVGGVAAAQGGAPPRAETPAVAAATWTSVAPPAGGDAARGTGQVSDQAPAARAKRVEGAGTVIGDQRQAAEPTASSDTTAASTPAEPARAEADAGTGAAVRGGPNGGTPTTIPEHADGGAPSTTPEHANGKTPPATRGRANGKAPPTTPGHANGKTPAATRGRANGKTPATTRAHGGGKTPAGTRAHAGGKPRPTTGRPNGTTPATTGGRDDDKTPTGAGEHRNGTDPSTTPSHADGREQPGPARANGSDKAAGTENRGRTEPGQPAAERGTSSPSAAAEPQRGAASDTAPGRPDAPGKGRGQG